MKRLAGKGADIYPIMSQNAYSLDTRFGMAADFIDEIETMKEFSASQRPINCRI